ncbi:MAG TPA: NAD(P)/FAD-dependent oxidoreductase, partial [Spongiibacteraceae bacterium]|nr:NAD(P)/FAD-dependent oxidoreductase [Spongiibacteraceae bacterium]
VDWSPAMQRHAGVPLKSVCLTVLDGQRAVAARKGEALVTAYGLEGSLIYALSAVLREQVARNGGVEVHWDLSPDRTLAEVERALRGARAGDSISNVLRKRLHISGAKAALLRELCGDLPRHDPVALAAAIKCLPQRLLQPRPLDEAISTAGGIHLDALTENLMLKQHPGIFCAGEMLDWEAPTGGYLLNACLASGRVAGQGAVAYLRRQGAL